MIQEDVKGQTLDSLLEQYKLYVEMADRVSQRREQANRFYVTLLSAVVALLVVMSRLGSSSDVWSVVLPVSGVFGMIVSIIWMVHLYSYRTLNQAKFHVINELEQKLPYAGYSLEWDRLESRSGLQKYLKLSWVEQLIPGSTFLLFGCLAVYGPITWVL